MGGFLLPVKKSVPEFGNDDEDEADVMQFAPENPSSTRSMTNRLENSFAIIFQK